MSTQEFVKPTIGQGATLRFPADSYPYVIVGVSESGKTVQVVPCHTVSTKTGHEPAYFEGPWPVWSHTYTPEELQTFKRDVDPETIRYTKNGWGRKGLRFTVGEARYHRNYSY